MPRIDGALLPEPGATGARGYELSSHEAREKRPRPYGRYLPATWPARASGVRVE